MLMEEVNKIITLCSKDWAKIGVEFTFLGGKAECENCKIKRTCLRLREGAKYKIVGLRDGTVQECPLHDEGVVAVEVVEKIKEPVDVEKKASAYKKPIKAPVKPAISSKFMLSLIHI